MAKQRRKSTAKKAQAPAPKTTEEQMSETETNITPAPSEDTPTAEAAAGEAERAHDPETGEFVADNPETPDVNEAYVDGIGPDSPNAESVDDGIQEQGEASDDVGEAAGEAEATQAEPEPAEQEAPKPESKKASKKKSSNDEPSPELERLVKALTGYADVMSGTIVAPASLKAGAMAMHSAAYVMAQYPTNEILGTFLAFHTEYADTLMAENKALRGIDHLAPGQAPRVEMMYSIFRSLATGRPVAIAEDVFTKAFVAVPNHDIAGLLNWIEKRNKANKKKK